MAKMAAHISGSQTSNILLRVIRQRRAAATSCVDLGRFPAFELNSRNIHHRNSNSEERRYFPACRVHQKETTMMLASAAMLTTMVASPTNSRMKARLGSNGMRHC